MIENWAKSYSGSDLSGATAGVVFFYVIVAGTLQSVDVFTDAAQSGAAEFAVFLNGVDTGETVTIPNAAKIGTTGGLSIAVAKGDEIKLNLVSGNVSAPVTMNLAIDDGVTAGGGGASAAVVTWATITGAPTQNGNVYTKTEGDSFSNTTFVSNQSIADEGEISFFINPATTSKGIGLSYAGNAGGGMFTADHIILFGGGNNTSSWELGTQRATGLPGAGNSENKLLTIQVFRDDENVRKIRLLVDGVFQYLFPTFPTDDPLFVDTFIYTIGATMGAIKIKNN